MAATCRSTGQWICAGMPVRAIYRPGSQLLGANGHDDGPIILNLIPKESDGERFEDALAHVCGVVRGGTAMDNDDSDSDLEVVADSFTVNLLCPMSGSRMNVAGRFKPCPHIGCFDLDVFVEMKCCGEDVAEIEVKPDGSWRVKTKSESDRRELGELGLWHLPDSTLSVPTEGESIPKTEVLKQVKLEGVSEGRTGLKLGIRKNHNGFWEVSKPEDMNISSGNRLQEQFADHELKVIPMSSSATGSGRDGEDASVNQDGGGNFDFSTNNGIEMDSFSLNAYGFSGQNPSAPVGDAEVVLLSDSDDNIMPSGTIYRNDRTDASGISSPVAPSGIADSFGGDPTLGTGGNSCMGLFGNDDEFILLWPSLAPGTQSGPGFQLFTSEADVPDTLGGLQHGSIHCSTSMNGYTLAPETTMGSATLLPDSSVARSDVDMNGGLVDYPMAFPGDDPSLQIFLPTRPSDASVHSDLRDQADMSIGVHTDDWISLRLGGDASGINGTPATPNGLNSRGQMPSGEGAMDSLADTASLLLGMNDGSRSDTSRRRSNSPFSFPRQKRSARPRLYLSIDSDSD